MSGDERSPAVCRAIHSLRQGKRVRVSIADEVLQGGYDVSSVLRFLTVLRQDRVTGEFVGEDRALEVIVRPRRTT